MALPALLYVPACADCTRRSVESEIPIRRGGRFLLGVLIDVAFHSMGRLTYCNSYCFVSAMDDGIPSSVPTEEDSLFPSAKKELVAVGNEGVRDCILSQKKPNPTEPRKNAGRHGKCKAQFQPVSYNAKQPQQPHRKKTPSIFSAVSSTDDAIPRAVTTTNKPSPLLTQPPPQHHIRSNSSNNNTQNKQNNGFAFPTAPPLRFSSSIFNDIPMSLPDSTFGPNGCLPAPPASALLSTSSMGHPLIGASMFATPVPYSDMILNPGTSGDDLALVANALLDLTPAMVNKSPKKRLHHSNAHNNGIELKPSPKRNKPFEILCAASSKVISTRRDQVVSRARALLEGSPTRTIIACKCKSSHCLKLYCTCFQTGAICDELICVCKGCKNTAAETKPRGARTIAIHDILNRRPDAFEPRLKKKTGKGCACKKSQCLLKYCDCFANANPCSDQCGCSTCLNGKPEPPPDAASSSFSPSHIASNKTEV